METKKCAKCNNPKELTEFAVRKDSKDGYRNICKSCYNWRLYYDPSKNQERGKTYRDNNKESRKISTKHYRDKNKEKLNEANKLYREINKDQLKQRRDSKRNERNEYEKIKKETNPLYRLTCNTRSLLLKSFKNKNLMKSLKSEDILGCSFEKFKEYIESLWEPWMTWENKGNPKDGILELNKTWDIDHIIPLATAITEEDVIRLNHYTNLQPLCSYTNRKIKRDN